MLPRPLIRPFARAKAPVPRTHTPAPAPTHQFLGYNNVFDGDNNTHVPFIEFHKGRETEFSATVGRLSKISGGASATLRTRDVHRVYADLRMDLLTKMSLFYGSLGNYFAHLIAHLGQVTFLLLFFFLAVSGLMSKDDFTRETNTLGQVCAAHLLSFVLALELAVTSLRPRF